MSSNRARKTDNREKLRLLSGIEKFAEENNFDIDRLYDITIAEEIFAPEIQRLESRIADCDTLIERIYRADQSVWNLFEEIRELDKISNAKLGWSRCTDAEVHFEFISPIRYVFAQRQSQFRRRKWEILTYLDACRQYGALSKVTRQIPETVTPRMLHSAWTRTDDNP